MTSRPPVLTTRGRTFAVAGLLAIIAGTSLGFPDVTRLGFLAVLLPLIAHLLVRRPAPQFAVRRTVAPGRLRVGETGRVRLDITNTADRRTPLYLAEERLSYALGDRPRFVLTSMGFRGNRRLQYTVRSHSRGRHQLGPLALRVRDPFGMAHVHMVLNSTDDVIVLPRVHRLVSTPKGQGRGNEGEIPFMIAAQGEDDVTVRQYREGDDLRHVHWPATAHRGELMVRQEDRPARRRAVLLLDPRRGAHGGRMSGSLEWSVSMLASIGIHLRDNGYAVHLVAAEDPDAPMPDEDLLGRLAVTTAIDDRETATRVVRETHALAAGGAVVIAAVVDYDEEYLRQLAQIREPGTAAIAFLMPAPTSRADSGDPGELLLSTGWRVIRVTTATPIEDAWLAATAGGSGAATPWGPYEAADPALVGVPYRPSHTSARGGAHVAS